MDTNQDIVSTTCEPLSQGTPVWAHQMQQSIVALTGMVQKINQALEDKTQICQETKAKVDILQKNNYLLESRIEKLEEKLLIQELQKRRDNLIIHGLQEPAWETTEKCTRQVIEFMTALEVDLSDISFENI